MKQHIRRDAAQQHHAILTDENNPMCHCAKVTDGGISYVTFVIIIGVAVIVTVVVIYSNSSIFENSQSSGTLTVRIHNNPNHDQLAIA